MSDELNGYSVGVIYLFTSASDYFKITPTPNINMTTVDNDQHKYQHFSAIIEQLTQAENSIQEEHLIAELLKAARNDFSLNYGYRVHSITRQKLVPINELDQHFDDELMVTIFVGDHQPYREYAWRPKDTTLITRMIMP